MTTQMWPTWPQGDLHFDIPAQNHPRESNARKISRSTLTRSLTGRSRRERGFKGRRGRRASQPSGRLAPLTTPQSYFRTWWAFDLLLSPIPPRTPPATSRCRVLDNTPRRRAHSPPTLKCASSTRSPFPAQAEREDGGPESA
jgi:hypothetical protein